MNIQHAPAPWTKGDSPIVYDDNAEEICLLLTENIANKRLIETAPELLEVLTSTLCYIQDLEAMEKAGQETGYKNGVIRKQLNTIEKVIEKATGIKL